MNSLLRAFALLILAAQVVVVAVVLVGVALRAPTWVALHYAPSVLPSDRCAPTVARLRAVMRRAGREEPTAEESALLDTLLSSGQCDAGSAELRAIEARIAAPAP